MSEPSVEEIARVFEACGEDTLRDFVEILLARNAELVAALEAVREAIEDQDDLEAFAIIKAALLAAGQPQGSGE
jgi:hypothetical protein